MRRSANDGTPIEQAPVWVPAIAAVLIARPIFPSLVGLATVAAVVDRWRWKGEEV